jgi:hypothetical protein
MPKVAQKPSKSIVLKCWLQNTAPKKLVLAAISVLNINGIY